MAIDQLRRPCTIVLHDDSTSTDDVLCGSHVLPTGILARLSASGATPIYVIAVQPARSADELSIHRSLAERFGFENRANGTVELIEDITAATATHVEFFFKEQHLSRADMWRIMQRLDGTVINRGQKVYYLGSLAAEIRAVYHTGHEVSSAYVTPSTTRPIFRSGSARYSFLIQVSREMLEYWVDGSLIYEHVIAGFLPELFHRWDQLKVKHQVSMVLFGRTADGDFYHVLVEDSPSAEWRDMLRKLKRAFNGTSLRRRVSLAAQGNIVEALHMAAMDFANDNIDPHLSSRGQSIVAITAGAGLFETTHGMLKSTTRLLMGNSIGVDIVALSPKPLHPVPLFSYQRDILREYALPHWVDISFWSGHRVGYASTWLLLDATDATDATDAIDGVALQLLDSEQHWITTSATTAMSNYDDAIFSTHSNDQPLMTLMARSKEAVTKTESDLTAFGDTNTPTDEALASTSPLLQDHTIRAVNDSQVPRFVTASKRSKVDVLPPHSLMATGRKISLGPRGLAPGRSLASTTLSVTHAEPDKQMQNVSAFAPDAASSNLADQIKQLQANGPIVQSLRSRSPASSTLQPVEGSKPIAIVGPGEVAASGDLDPASLMKRTVLDSKPDSDLAYSPRHSGTPKAKKDVFYAAVKAAEEEGNWDTSPWLTLLNPSNPTRDNMRVAAQYRKWQHVFPRAVSSSDFKWSSMCTPAALPLTTEYKPSPRELDRHFSKRMRRLLVQGGPDHADADAGHTLAQLTKLRLIHGFQIASAELADGKYGQSSSPERVLLSLGNVHHELQCLSSAEVQIMEYSLIEGGTTQSPRVASIDGNYRARFRSAASSKGAETDVALAARHAELDWTRLDEQVLAHHMSDACQGSMKMRLVLIPVESMRPGHATPGPARGLSDEERRIDGIQKLTQQWQRNRYTSADEQRHQVSLARSKATPRATARDPNPLAIEYQTRDPSEVVNAYGPVQDGQLNSPEPTAPLFAESEMYHSSNFDVAKLVKQMQEHPPHGVEVRDRRWFARVHLKCFRGDEMVNWLLRVFKDLDTRDDAIAIGNELMNRSIFSHVRLKHEFRDGNYFYQITSAHRTTEYPDTASFFGKASLRSVPFTPISESRASPMLRAVHEDASSSGKPTPTTGAFEKKHLLLSQQMLYNVDPGRKSDQLEVVTLHYDRIHNPENCYHIQLEWVNTTAVLIRDAINRWSTAVESHGLRLVQLPLVEACKVHLQHPFGQPIPVKLALRPPDKLLRTPVLAAHAFTPHLLEDVLAYQKALLRKMDFVLDFEAAASFTAKLDVLYSYGKPDYDMTQFVHESGRLLVQISGSEQCDFLLLPNRLASTRSTTASRQADTEPVEEIVKRFVKFCRDEQALKQFYQEVERSRVAPRSPWTSETFHLDGDIPPMQLPPLLAHRAAMRNVL